MDSLLTNLFTCADRRTIGVLLIKKVFSCFLVFTISQLSPGFSQAVTLDKRQVSEIIPYDGFMFRVSSSIQNMDNFILAVDEPVKLRSETINHGLPGTVEPLPLVEADSEKVAKQKSSQNTKEGFERMAFYETEQFHAYVTGMIIGLLLLALFIIF